MYMTPCSPHDDCLTENSKRKLRVILLEPELVEEVPDERLFIEKLCDALVLGAREG